METTRLYEIIKDNNENYAGTDPIKDAMALHEKSISAIRSKTLKSEELSFKGLKGGFKKRNTNLFNGFGYGVVAYLNLI